MCRLFGASLVGFGIRTWQLRKLREEAPLRSLATALAVSDALGALVAVWGTATGVVNGLGWTTVAIYALLGAGFANFALRKPAPATA